MQVAVFQGPLISEDTMSAMGDVAAEAAEAKARLLVMPELFLTGYNIGADAVRARAETQDGAAARAAAAIARTHGIALLYGYPERGELGYIYNSAMLIGADGSRLANYRKLHLWGDMERAVFTPGDQPFVLAEIDGMKVGVLICYDVEFPEMVRGLALQGAEILAVPTASMRPYEFIGRILVRARAYENQVALIYANRCGAEGDLVYTGESCIVGPDGSELARAGTGAELIMADLHPGLFADAHVLNGHLRDRLPKHYANAPGFHP